MFFGIILILGIFLFQDSPKNKFTVRNSYPELSFLQGKNFNFAENSKFFAKLAQDQGGEYAYKALAYATTRSIFPANIDTHLLGHVVGDELFKQKGLFGMQFCTDDLRNACSHSIVVGGLLAEGIDAINKMVGVCKGAPGGKGAYRMCVHGLGHGVLAFTDYDMRKAVDLCKPIATTSEYSNMEFVECIGGITMEMMAGVNDKQAWEKQKVNYFKSNDPLAPCNLGFIPEKAVHICYTFLTPHLFESAGINPGAPPLPMHLKKAFTFCEKIPENEGRNRESCFGGFGKEFVVLANERNVQSVENMDSGKLAKIDEWCNLAIDEGIKPCLYSALQSLFWGGENKRDVAIRFCSIMEDKQKQTFCFENLIGAVSYYIVDAKYRAEFCSEIPEGYRTECKSKLELKEPARLISNKVFFDFNKIRVTENEKYQRYADQILKLCGDKNYRPACYDEEIPKLMDSISMEDAFKVTKLVQKQDSEYLYCHVLAHNLSAQEVAKNPDNWKDVVIRCPSGTCSNGCIHGGFQERFRAESFSAEQIEVLVPDLKILCEPRGLWKPTGLEQGSCYHALGHLTMYLTAADIDTSLKLCDRVALPFLQLCYDGAFMQIFQPLEPEDFALIAGKEVKKEKLKDFCSNFKGKQKSSCWSEGWPLFRPELLKPAGLVAFCSLDNTPEPERCISTLIYVLSAQFHLDADKIVNYCSDLPEVWQGRCFANAATRMIETDYSLAERAVSVCNAPSRLEVKNECFRELLIFSTYNYHPKSEGFYTLCESLPGDWQTKCLANKKNERI